MSSFTFDDPELPQEDVQQQLQQQGLQYDAQFIELLQTLDPTEVNDELILAANSAMIQQEKVRSRWARRGVLADAAAASSNIADAEDLVEQQQQQQPAPQAQNNDDDDDDSVSSSSCASSSSSSSSSSFSSSEDSSNDDDTPNKKEKVYKDDDVATAFCRSFLAPKGAVEHFVRDVRATAQTLQSLRSTIKRFARRIDGVASEVGVLQSKARETERTLVNTHNVRQLTSAAIEALMPCQGMSRVLCSAVRSADEDASSGSAAKRGSMSDLPEMGRQIVHSVRQLETLLAARQARVLNVAAAAQHSAPMTTSSEEEQKKQQQQQQQAISSSSCLVLDLRKAPALENISSQVVDSLARQACLLVRNFIIPRVATVLGKPRTNITIQQRSALLPYRAVVKFLKSCATNPEFLAMRNNRNAAENDDEEEQNHHLPVISAAEAASAFYAELRATYIHYTACAYVTNFQNYIGECLALQQPKMFLRRTTTTPTASSPPSHQQQSRQHAVAAPPPPHAAAAASSGGGGWLDSASNWFSGGYPTTSAAPSGQPHHHSPPPARSSSSSTAHLPSFPNLADVAANILPSDFSSRVVDVAQDVHKQILSAHPILPMVQKAQMQQLEQQQQQQQQQLSAAALAAKKQSLLNNPIETFRSLQQMLSDVVTSEFLFSFEFFDGDTSVYSGVFRPVMDLLVQFVMANFLPQQQQRISNNSSTPTGGGGLADAQDAVGLGLLSLITITFRREMHNRSLHCLDEFYSHILLLLLPSMKRAVDQQHMSLKSLMVADTAAAVSPTTTVTSPGLVGTPQKQQRGTAAGQRNQQQDAHLHSLDLFMRVNGIAGSASSLLLSAKSSSSSSSSSSSNSSGSINYLLLRKTHPVVERFAHLTFALRFLAIRMSPLFSDSSSSSSDPHTDLPLGATAASSSSFGPSPSSTSDLTLTEATTTRGRRRQLAEDDSEEMLLSLCVSCTAMAVDFGEWLRSFCKFFVRSCFPSHHQQQQQKYQAVPENLESVFLVRNLGSVLTRWAELGFAARVPHRQQQQNGEEEEEEDDGKNDEADADEHHHHHHHHLKRRNSSRHQNVSGGGLPPLSSSSSANHHHPFSDSTADFVVTIDKMLVQSYEDAVESLAYDILQYLAGDVIISVRDAEVKIQDGDSSSEHHQQKQQQMPLHLETAARRFAEAAKDLPGKIAVFCQKSLSKDDDTNGGTTLASSSNLHHHHPALDRLQSIDSVNPHLDVMKKSYTQLLLWNTRLHAALGIFLNGGGAAVQTQVARQQQQRLRGMTVSNVQLSQWMQQVL